MEKKRERFLSALTNLTNSDGDVPPVPQPTSKDSVAPKYSEELIVSTTKYYEDGQFAKDGSFPLVVTKKDEPNYFAFNQVDQGTQFDDFTVLDYVAPTFPKQKIQYIRYWLNTFSVTLSGSQSFEREITTSEGMSTTETETLSVELGVEVPQLSAKLSASIGQSITVSASTEVSTKYSFDVPENKVAIWTLWQLVEKFVFVDNNNNPIIWEGWVNRPIGMPNIIVDYSLDENTFINSLETYYADIDFFDE